jgi:hypothetical protein
VREQAGFVKIGDVVAAAPVVPAGGARGWVLNGSVRHRTSINWQPPGDVNEETITEIDRGV